MTTPLNTGIAAPLSALQASSYDPNNPLAYYASTKPGSEYRFLSAATPGQSGTFGPEEMRYLGDGGNRTLYGADGAVVSGDDISNAVSWKDAGTPAYMQSGNGTLIPLNADGTFSDTFDRPGGNSKEKNTVTYKYDVATGKVVPVSAAEKYQASDWVTTGQPIAQLAGSMLAAYVGGAGLQSLGGSSTGAAGLSGMDLAADAAAGTGNNIYTAGSALGAADAAAPAASSIANTGSDAHFYQPQAGGTGVQDLANMGGAGTPTTPTWTGSGGSPGALNQLGSSLKNAGVGDVLNGAKTVLPLISAIAGSGKTNSNTGGAGGNAALPASSPADMGKANRYNYEGFVADPSAVPSRPGHTMGPSSAVNMSDPSAAMFGYGKTPLYYQPGPSAGLPSPVVPGSPRAMADGGEVESDAQFLPDNTDTGGNVYGRMEGDPYDAHLGGSPLLGGINSSQGSGLPESPPEGILGWFQRLAKGDKSTQGQLAMGMGGLGLLAALLQKRNVGPGYQTVSQLRSGLPNGNGTMTPQQLLAMTNYFNAPAARYVAPAPRSPSRYASGGGIDQMLDAGGAGSPERFNPTSHGAHVAAGPGGGQDDRVDAALSPGEYVMDADVVSALGDGSNAHGARMLDGMREAIRTHKRAAPADSIPPRALSPLSYLKQGSR